MQEIREAFSLFDRDSDGRLEASDLGSFLRSLGRNPTEAQIRTILTSTSSLGLPDLLSVLARMPAVDPAQLERELRAAFKVFDKEGKGMIPAGELKHIVTSLGERLSDAEAEEMLMVADPTGSGSVDYEQFIQAIVSA